MNTKPQIKWLEESPELAGVEISLPEDHMGESEHLRAIVAETRAADRERFPWLLPALPADAEMPFAEKRFGPSGVGVENVNDGGISLPCDKDDVIAEAASPEDGIFEGEW